jgi:hypothetical protein
MISKQNQSAFQTVPTATTQGISPGVVLSSFGQDRQFHPQQQGHEYPLLQAHAWVPGAALAPAAVANAYSIEVETLPAPLMVQLVLATIPDNSCNLQTVVDVCASKFSPANDLPADLDVRAFGSGSRGPGSNPTRTKTFTCG